MAKRRRRGSGLSGGRVTPANANRRLPRQVSALARFSDRYSDDLIGWQDRRLFYPSRSPMDWAPARMIGGAPARLRVSSPRVKKQGSGRRPAQLVPVGVAFSAPRKVLVCVRRQRRKEVLHALGVAGRRGLSGGRAGLFSSISCRR